ncbi:XRE family transcriptional regulator [Pseudomonas putida S11]|nr:XRE family transcriptional regulator [Pseudomonas putida S11]
MSIRLKLLRKKLGMTLELLADKTGMTKSYLSKVERGLNTPSIAAALKLARALNVNVEELFAEEQTGQNRYSLVRHGERQALVGDGAGPGYSALTSQVGRAQPAAVPDPAADRVQRPYVQGAPGRRIPVRPRRPGGSGLHERAGTAGARRCLAFQCPDTTPAKVGGAAAGAVAGRGASHRRITCPGRQSAPRPCLSQR